MGGGEEGTLIDGRNLIREHERERFSSRIVILISLLQTGSFMFGFEGYMPSPHAVVCLLTLVIRIVSTLVTCEQRKMLSTCSRITSSRFPGSLYLVELKLSVS